MDERRKNVFTFTTERAFIRFFSTIMSEKEIKNFMDKEKARFVPRQDYSAHANKLQFLKKCENKLMRRLREALQKNKPQ
jgi:hypothetical protein